ncbi:30S ribosomal protein S4 [Planosporangium flavigriseum]|uniref:Small ribosomal subunit protein uS4 n=2 Tax=Planosporangium flavigriseum TaxID=373681 RepID=A0A8J3LI65_9ACTN|nr:30S ribosomal protein S4 [Planosporangium flavigriseum]NJC65128.1 30S ribosomal protein S4 [Planosporangium flavigriseum]GIG71744.1 30S ribosomal protein S4 [Planosporangium flavigriseum]
MPTRPKVRISRAMGIPLTPKATRYFERRPYPPGVHGRRRRNPSDYRLRLLEKQRLRHQYDVRERQLRRVVDEAFSSPRRTGEVLIELLERRLDAVVLRAGFARTIYQARQMVSHGHFEVDGQRVDIPSYRLRPGQTVRVREAARDKPPFVLAAAGANAPAGPIPPYLDVRMPELAVTLAREPRREEVPVVCDETMVVEFYSR